MLVFFITFPMYQILELTPITTGRYNIVHFVFLVAFFRDLNRARPRHGLARKGP